jgi:hypothetical protein
MPPKAKMQRRWATMAACDFGGREMLFFGAKDGTGRTIAIADDGSPALLKKLKVDPLFSHCAYADPVLALYTFATGAGALAYVRRDGSVEEAKGFNVAPYWTTLASDGYQFLFYRLDQQWTSARTMFSDTGSISGLAPGSAGGGGGPAFDCFTSSRGQLIAYSSSQNFYLCGYLDPFGNWEVIWSNFSFPDQQFTSAFTHMAGTASHLIFYNMATGAAMTAQVTQGGAIQTLKTFDLKPHYTNVLATAFHVVLVKNLPSSCRGITGSIAADGTFTEAYPIDV